MVCPPLTPPSRPPELLLLLLLLSFLFLLFLFVLLLLKFVIGIGIVILCILFLLFLLLLSPQNLTAPSRPPCQGGPFRQRENEGG